MSRRMVPRHLYLVRYWCADRACWVEGRSYAELEAAERAAGRINARCPDAGAYVHGARRVEG